MNMMKITPLLMASLLTAPVCAQDEAEVPAADEWYRSAYAPLYHDKPWDKAEDIASYYAETVHNHDEGGSHDNSFEWFSAMLEEWKIEGWIRSELAELDYESLNSTTASFKAKWRDFYTGGNIAYECAWYLADYADGKWRISEYASINCSDHGL